MIRFIIHTTSSKVDTNGNRYHFATIRSTVTGRRFPIQNVDGETNIEQKCRIFGVSWEEMDCSYSVLPIREFWKERRSMTFSGVSDVAYFTKEMLLNLEKPIEV